MSNVVDISGRLLPRRHRLMDPGVLRLVKGDSESYKHAAARTVVARWIDEIEQQSDSARIAFGLPHSQQQDQVWRRNRGGVIEVPVTTDDILAGHNNTYAWDERYQFGGVPTYQQCTDAGLVVAMIFDVAVYHKGTIAFAIEVCHRHAVDDGKEALILKFGAPVYEMDAEWILRQVGRPSTFQAVRNWN